MVDSTLPTGPHIPAQVTTQQVAQWVSVEERRAVVQKMIETLKMPAGNLPKDQSLYLEQQLTDLLGFEIASELDGNHLPHTFGLMAGLPHLKRHPQDELLAHDQVREAGIEPTRSCFGWFTEMGQLTEAAIAREKYFVTVQVNLSDDWRLRSTELKEWYKYRKVIVINPTIQKAMVACIGDLGPGNWIQHQFGGSPEIIRELSVWDLPSQGKVFVFFVNDPEEKIPLGIVDMNVTI